MFINVSLSIDTVVYTPTTPPPPACPNSGENVCLGYSVTGMFWNGYNTTLSGEMNCDECSGFGSCDVDHGICNCNSTVGTGVWSQFKDLILVFNNFYLLLFLLCFVCSLV